MSVYRKLDLITRDIGKICLLKMLNKVKDGKIYMRLYAVLQLSKFVMIYHLHLCVYAALCKTMYIRS